MIKRYPYKDLIWIDVQQPTNEEVLSLLNEFSLPEEIGKDMLTSTGRPRADYYLNCMYAVLHFPAIKHSWTVTPNQEIDFIIGKKFLITVRYDEIDSIHKFSKIFEVHSLLDKGSLGEHSGYLFTHIARKLYRSLHHEIEYINDRLKDVEQQIFSGYEKEMVFELSSISRTLIHLRHTIRSHDSILSSLEHSGTRFFGETFRAPIHSVTLEHNRVFREIEGCRDMLHELRETNNSLLSVKHNDSTRSLTMMAFTTFPLTLIAGIFSMRTIDTPIIEGPHAFAIILGGMAVTAIVILSFFKWKKWL